MKRIISVVLTVLACLLAMTARAETCDRFFGNKDFSLTFDVVEPALDSHVLLEHHGEPHSREVLWYTGIRLDDSNHYFYEPNLLVGQGYNIRIKYTKKGRTLKYYRKFSGEAEWQLIDVKDNADLKNGKLTLKTSGSPNNIDCGGNTPTPDEPELPDNLCQYFPEPIQGMKGSFDNTLVVPNRSARALGWSEEYKTYYTVTDKQELFRYSSSIPPPRQSQFVLAGFDTVGQLDAQDRLYMEPMCASDAGCDVGNNDGQLEARKADEPLGVPTDFGSSTLSLQAHDIGSICDNSNLCSATRYSVDGKQGIEILIKKNLDKLLVSQNNSPFEQVKVILPDGINIREFKAEAGPQDDLRIVFPQDAEVTFGRWVHTGHTKYSFNNHSRINVSGSSVVFNNPIAITTHYYVTLYAPNANILFKTHNPDFYGFILANRISFENPITIHGSVTSRHLTMKNSVVIRKPDYTCPIEPPAQQCNLLPIETFSSDDISNWSVMGYESSTEPRVDLNRKRFVLNANKTKQATASAYNYLFPSKDNYLEVEFDHYAHSGSGADGVALVLSDANVPPQTGAFGGPLGYGVKPNVQGFAGGWIGFGIDEYGNYSREGSLDDGQYRPGFKPNTVAIRGSGIKNGSGQWMEGYRYIKGNHNVGDLDRRSSPNHRYKVIIDSKQEGKVYITIQRKVGNANAWTTLISKFDVMRGFGQTTPPENFRVSITASTGDITNIHEMDNFQVCADKFQKITQGIHHFEFDYAGTGSICQASEVTLRACMNEPCTETYPASVLSDNSGAVVSPVTVSLLPQSSSLLAWEGGDRVTFSDSVSLKLQAYQSGSAKLGIASSSVPQFGFEGAKCRIGGGALSEQNCNILFNSAALGVNIPDKVAGKPFFDSQGKPQYGSQSSPYLEFCSSPSQQNGAGEERDIQLSLERIEPVRNALSVPAYVSFKKQNGTFSNEVSIDVGTAVSVNDVYFDSQGKAYFNLSYPEAGKVALKAKIKGESNSLGQNSFVSFPAYLTLSTDGGECASGSCTQGFVAASEPFKVTITAHQFDGKKAKNYQQDGLTISHKVTYPSIEGLSAGVLNTNVYNHDAPKDGKVTFEQSVSEVGAFEFTVTPPESYLGSKAFVIQPAKEVVGRFYPKFFKVYDGKEVEWAYPNSQSFTYMGQPFGVSKFYVEALNASKGTLTNYAFFDDTLLAAFNIADHNANKARFYATKRYDGLWKNTNGSAMVESRSIGEYRGNSGDGLVMEKGSGTAYPDGPFNFNEIGQDTLLSISGANSRDPVSVVEGESTLSPQPDIRFGRIDLDDVGEKQGTDTVIHIPLRIEYWNGDRFTLNLDDSQTRVLGDKAKQVHMWPTGDGAKQANVELSAGGDVISGRSRSIEAREAESNRQQTRVWLNLDPSGNDLPWLKYNWNKEQAGEENPSSVVTFGIHRGNDRVIYRGEPGITGQ
ncbi:DUF6701 domain-containing protein [Vibrio alfacsensis]|uniref:DUF6701 domain-containing protein n=1 Tax=Vibrio alfacsensis TaxID=1074311 RepID=UPI0040698E50